MCAGTELKFNTFRLTFSLSTCSNYERYERHEHHQKRICLACQKESCFPVFAERPLSSGGGWSYDPFFLALLRRERQERQERQAAGGYKIQDSLKALLSASSMLKAETNEEALARRSWLSEPNLGK